MFNKDSVIVRTWVRLVTSGHYTKDQVPELDNLREIVFGLINKVEE